MKVSFIIRTLNEADALTQVLRRINSLEDDFEKEVIIVDSGSTDNNLEIAEAHSVVVINISPQDWSWGKALNLGIGRCEGDYIAVISGHCFITKRDFLVQGISLLNKSQMAAVYGRQLPIPYMDPFEEYELHMCYPNRDLVTMDFRTLIRGKGVGISNACCILKKDVWARVKYDETVESLEDAIWAFDVARTGQELAYSNRLSVFHSHPFDLEYVYRKWYWRTYESLDFYENFIKKYVNKFKVILKRALKKAFLSKILFLKRLNDRNGMRNLLSPYPFIKSIHISTYLNIVKRAQIDAYNDFVNGNKQSYWLIQIPEKVSRYQERFLDVGKYLRPDFSHLESVESLPYM